jgi:citrate lyase beta subunit
MIIYDLEDSIPPSKEDKDTARARLSAFIRKQVCWLVKCLFTSSFTVINAPFIFSPKPTHGSSQDKKRAAVRINAASTSHFESDIKALVGDAGLYYRVLHTNKMGRMSSKFLRL